MSEKLMKRIKLPMDPFLAKRVERVALSMGVGFEEAVVKLLELATRLRDKATFESARRELKKILP